MNVRGSGSAGRADGRSVVGRRRSGAVGEAPTARGRHDASGASRCRRSAALACALAALALGGCAAAQKKACEEGDWEGLGYRDGRAGLGFERVGVLSDRCSDYDIDVDSAAWTRGHAEGIAEYCEPTRGFDLGERGAEYTGNCPAALEGRYLASYVRGLDIRRDELQLAYDRLRRDLDDARRQREALDPEDDADDLEERIDDFEDDLEQNLAARREMNALIGRWSRRL